MIQVTAQYLISIDIGTAGTKAAVFDSEGNQLATAYEESKLFYPKIGWVEQRPNDFYSSAINTVKQAVKESKIDPKDAVAIALSGQMGGTLGIDRDWKAVTPYDSWLDTRCEAYIDYIRENYIDLVLDIVGVPPLE